MVPLSEWRSLKVSLSGEVTTIGVPSAIVVCILTPEYSTYITGIRLSVLDGSLGIVLIVTVVFTYLSTPAVRM